MAVNNNYCLHFAATRGMYGRANFLKNPQPKKIISHQGVVLAPGEVANKANKEEKSAGALKQPTKPVKNQYRILPIRKNVGNAGPPLPLLFSGTSESNKLFCWILPSILIPVENIFDL